MNQFTPFRKRQPMSGAQKSAILFLCLGEERGGALMQQLDVAEIRKITEAISTMGEVQSEVVEEIMQEFGEKIGDFGAVTGSVGTARSLLQGFLPEERVEEILGEIAGKPEDDVWSELSKLDEKKLADFLRREHNQTVAVILSNLTPDAVARVIPLMGEERVTDLIERMMATEELPKEALENIEDSLRSGILASAGRGAEAKIEKTLVSVFNKLDDKVFQGLSRELEKRMPDQFRAIKQKMFVFNDLGKVPPNALAKVIREISGNTLPMALRGAEKDVREYVLSSLPQRSRDMLQDEMKSMGAVRSRDVKQAQSAMVEIAMRLASEGEIDLPSDDGEEMID
ncbi:flagellar motor switch protein FliG [Shimia sp.]|uniref:flagellar motor switch protein FliG n=1 Tax=Shimia sp. TaxID=1954381 RepID=UPI00356604A5